MKIYLHDLIGIHSGVNYYLDTFVLKMAKHNIDVVIKSNYNTNDNNPYYPNIFKGFKLKRFFLLLISYSKFFYSICKLKKQQIIIVSLYGTYVDLGLILISKISKNRVLLDVHEVVDDNHKGLLLTKLFKYSYKFCKNIVIGHSNKVIQNLSQFGYLKKVVFTPHINYEIDSLINKSNVNNDVINSFSNGFVHFLFFGTIIPSKGIFNLLSAIEKLSLSNNKIRIIIAGKDRLYNITNYSNYNEIEKKSKLILRHLNDDEMKYLFKNSDYLILPYLDIAQSGVLEMAINFRKPILSSNIKYFKDKFSKYPSFGKSFNTNDPANFAKILESESKNNNQLNYYNDKDLDRYFNPEQFNDFVTEIKSHLNR